MVSKSLQKYFMATILAVFYLITANNVAYAVEVNDIAENIIRTSENLPGLLTGISFLLGLGIGITAVFKLKEHVDNPSQGALKSASIRALTAGSLFALPIVFEAMQALIDGGNETSFGSENTNAVSILSTIMGGLSDFIPTMDVNHVLANITEAIEKIPAFIAAIAYLLGTLLGVLGVLKIKEHVENPQQVPLKEGTIRLVIGGALFAIPTIYDAAFNAINGSGLGFFGQVSSGFGAFNLLFSSETSNIACNPVNIPFVGAVLNFIGVGGGSSLGNVVCNLMRGMGAAPNFLIAISYVFGLVFGFWGLLKIRDHVLNPQVTLSEGVTRLLAAGAFFALPLLIEVARNTVTPESLSIVSSITTNTGFNESAGAGGGSIIDSILGGDFVGAALSFFGVGGSACSAGGGLDLKLACFMSDIFGPVTVVLNFFGLVAGTILIMIGISRLIKSTQEGAKGPLGLGTLMTFLTGGALISSNALIRAFSTSFFQSPITFTYAQMQYTDGLNAAELAHAHTVISAIMKFVIMIGLISFVRGIIIVRDVAEGKQQATLMAGMTHIIGGALAVNLGPLLNAVQTSLGIGQFGILFT